MVVKTVAPYGSWESPFSVDDATAGSKSLSSPRGDVRDPNPASHTLPAVAVPQGTRNKPNQPEKKADKTPPRNRSAQAASSSSSPRRTAPIPSWRL